MAQGLISDAYLYDIANAIRNKTGFVNNFYPSEMANAINAIPTGGGSNLGTKTITANGIYNALDDSLDGYNSVNVQVSSDIVIDDDGWLLQSFNLPVIISENVTNCATMFNGFNAFNQPIEIPNSVTVCSWMFRFAQSFNQPLVIPDSVIGCGNMLFGASAYNSPVTFGSSVTNCLQAIGNCESFNQDVTIPHKCSTAYKMLFNDVSFSKNVYIDNADATSFNYQGLLEGCNNSLVKNVFCYDLSKVNGSGTVKNGIVNAAITWTETTNGYYNAEYNIYLYNNYLGPLRDQSYYQRFQANEFFNLAINTTNTVQNMAFAVNFCTNFNNTVQISDSVTNCVSMFNGCWNFNAPITIGNNVVDMGAMFRNCNNFNQPITIPNTAINCRTLLQGTSYNHPLTIPDKVTNCKWMLFNACDFNQPLSLGNNVIDCQQMLEAYYWDDATSTDHFEGGNFNQDIYFPYSVANYKFTLAGQQNFEKNIYINNRLADSINTDSMLLMDEPVGGYKRKNVFCYNLSILNRTSTNTLVGEGTPITWTAIDNGYYNADYNIYLYNNYLGKQGGSSLTSMISVFAKRNFNLPVSMEDTVTDCYNMLANCFNFNSPVEFSNNLQNGQRAMRLCNNFNLPITVPASLTDTYQMFGYCTNLNSPITFTHGLTNMYGMFRHCDNLNQPLNIPNTVVNCYEAICYTAMNCDVYIPASVTDCVYMMSGTNVFEGNIYINGTPNCKGLLEDRDYTTRVNIFCNDLSILTGTTSSDSITDLDMTWTEMTNGYYNEQYNIYLYNNYEGEPLPTPNALHIYTKSTGGSDAAMYVQGGTWDGSTFSPIGTVNSLIYTAAGSGVEYDGIVNLKYPGSNWYANALTPVNDGTNNYNSGDLIKTWPYSSSVNFYVYKREE